MDGLIFITVTAVAIVIGYTVLAITGLTIGAIVLGAIAEVVHIIKERRKKKNGS